MHNPAVALAMTGASGMPYGLRLLELLQLGRIAQVIHRQVDGRSTRPCVRDGFKRFPLKVGRDVPRRGASRDTCI